DAELPRPRQARRGGPDLARLARARCLRQDVRRGGAPRCCPRRQGREPRGAGGGRRIGAAQDGASPVRGRTPARRALSRARATRWSASCAEIGYPRGMKNLALVLSGVVVGALAATLLVPRVMADAAHPGPTKWQQLCEPASSIAEASSMAGARGNEG